MTPHMRNTLALVGLATLLAGCALSQGVAADALPSGAVNPPAANASGALPPNAFGPSPNHYFGTGGP